MVYSVSHHHDCDNIAGLPSSPAAAQVAGECFHREREGTVQHNTLDPTKSKDFYGYKAPRSSTGSRSSRTVRASGPYDVQPTNLPIESNDDYVVVGGPVPEA